MNRPMTKEEAKAWKAGFEAVERIERDELQRESPEEKFRALAFLMASAGLFDMSALEAEDNIARARWAQLQSTVIDG